jgi:hypothetical protein
MSGAYLRAIEHDLRGLLQSKSDVLLFSSSAAGRLPDVDGQSVPFDSRVRDVVGGSQVALNIRTLGYALREARRIGSPELRRVVVKMMDQLPEAEVHKRKPSTDREVQKFIRRVLQREPLARPTTLLRRWRSQGRACEQGRFRDLFLQVSQGLEGQTKLELRS